MRTTWEFSSVQCYFDNIKEENFKESNVEVYFAETRNLDTEIFRQFISEEEAERAEMFISEKDRSTFICCHALLRIVLSSRLNTAPEKIIFMKEKGNKPVIKDYPLHFNLSHTHESFAFVISDRSTGIDLENIHRKLDLPGFINASFNSSERHYITASSEEIKERLCILWTRKEAFLKALGIGIITDLRDIKVSGKRNLISRKVAATFQDKCMITNCFIYSTRILDSYLSIAFPGKAHIMINIIDSSNVNSLIK